MSTQTPTKSLDVKTCPVLEFFSQDTIHSIQQFIQDGGNGSYKTHRFIEFFQALDWLPLEDIHPNPLTKLPPTLRKTIETDIQAYFQHKAEKRNSSQQKYAEYQHRLRTYYKERLSASDKALLEALRDFELDLTGKDQNWQYYFGVKSFKRIDEFASADVQARRKWIEAFRQDVLTYKKNYERLKQAAAMRNYSTDPMEFEPFSFDEWCDYYGDAVQTGQTNSRSNQSKHNTPPPNSKVHQGPMTLAIALNTFQATLDTPWTEIKKRFRHLSLKYHPDMPGGDEEQMKTVLSAYSVIKHHSRSRP